MSSERDHSVGKWAGPPCRDGPTKAADDVCEGAPPDCSFAARHGTNITHDQAQYSAIYLFPLCVTFIKLSILFQYRRLFAAQSRTFIIQTNVLISLTVLWCVAILVLAGFLCQPITKLWMPEIPGTCLDLVEFYYGIQIPNIVVDLLIVLLPIRETLKLDMSTRLKFGASIMFLFGIMWVTFVGELDGANITLTSMPRTLVFDIIRLVVLLRLKSQPPDSTCGLISRLRTIYSITNEYA